MENGPCIAVRGRDPGRGMFRSTSEANVATVVRFCQTLLQKIHDSYQNFLIMYAKQSICSSLLD